MVAMSLTGSRQGCGLNVRGEWDCFIRDRLTGCGVGGGQKMKIKGQPGFPDHRIARLDPIKSQGKAGRGGL